LPLMSAIGLPGRRVEAMRAGITTIGFMGCEVGGCEVGAGVGSTGRDFLEMRCRLVRQPYEIGSDGREVG
jgi:hypothetical protein